MNHRWTAKVALAGVAIVIVGCSAKPAASGDWTGTTVGELVTERFAYDGGREVTVYVPPGRPEAIVFAGDGALIAPWGSLLEGRDLPPTMIVGVHHANDEAARLHEYSPGFDPERFAAHERFFVEDVRRWVAARFGVALPAERTAVLGESAGELALALGLRHSEIYGAVFAASPGGGYRPPTPMPSPLPRVSLVAGTSSSPIRRASMWPPSFLSVPTSPSRSLRLTSTWPSRTRPCRSCGPGSRHYAPGVSTVCGPVRLSDRCNQLPRERTRRACTSCRRAWRSASPARTRSAQR